MVWMGICVLGSGHTIMSPVMEIFSLQVNNNRGLSLKCVSSMAWDDYVWFACVWFIHNESSEDLNLSCLIVLRYAEPQWALHESLYIWWEPLYQPFGVFISTFWSFCSLIILKQAILVYYKMEIGSLTIFSHFVSYPYSLRWQQIFRTSW